MAGEFGGNSCRMCNGVRIMSYCLNTLHHFERTEKQAQKYQK
ncbi:hypothetical protein Plhal304r1_c046g0127191 [Plasmopara halstedii]